MKWISLIFATASMAALGWIVWKLVSLQDRRALAREDDRARAQRAKPEARESLDMAQRSAEDEESAR